MNPDQTQEIDKTLPKKEVSPSLSGRDACLVLIYPIGPGMGQRYPLPGTPIILGRDGACDIPINDVTVSRQHARIQLQEAGFAVVDLNSTNGTFVNDQRVASQVLQDSDSLHIGNAIFRFLAGGNVEAAYHEELHRLAIIDGLTGAYNQRYLLEFLEHELARAHRYRRPVTMIMFDIDHFKLINDSVGHLGGDYALRELSACVRLAMRKEAIFARYGGEEFGVVLPEATFDQGMIVAERIRSRIENHPFRYDGKDFALTVSLGVTAPEEGEEVAPRQLIARADELLYQAKRAGRNRVAPERKPAAGSEPRA